MLFYTFTIKKLLYKKKKKKKTNFTRTNVISAIQSAMIKVSWLSSAIPLRTSPK